MFLYTSIEIKKIVFNGVHYVSFQSSPLDEIKLCLQHGSIVLILNIFFLGQSSDVFATQSVDFMKPVVDIGKFFNNSILLQNVQ